MRARPAVVGGFRAILPRCDLEGERACACEQQDPSPGGESGTERDCGGRRRLCFVLCVLRLCGGFAFLCEWCGGAVVGVRGWTGGEDEKSEGEVESGVGERGEEFRRRKNSRKERRRAAEGDGDGGAMGCDQIGSQSLCVGDGEETWEGGVRQRCV